MRTFAISVKDQNGDWMTMTAIEVRVAEPIVVSSDTAGVVTISKAATPAKSVD